MNGLLQNWALMDMTISNRTPNKGQCSHGHPLAALCVITAMVLPCWPLLCVPCWKWSWSQNCHHGIEHVAGAGAAITICSRSELELPMLFPHAPGWIQPTRSPAAWIRPKAQGEFDTPAVDEHSCTYTHVFRFQELMTALHPRADTGLQSIGFFLRPHSGIITNCVLEKSSFVVQLLCKALQNTTYLSPQPRGPRIYKL